ncbi:hypothetical protein SAMN05518672_1184 [Chitinophaga sp. CF118]|uniref:hypothetical protein n=1 Tax=Chitinophaga sp. CF118 TaxID=1884367 RepID=UPI0008EA06DA|nr:hypothetical protein [Chitinophaga sp. CF118]SFF11479.1 hypothetical protein SAMN05518672_1184 [Chitinophaga sp. CF118]
MYKQNLLIFFVLLFSFETVQSQDYNPLKPIGKKAKIVTAYGNKFVEVFDTEDVQRVGSVLINIHTKKIVALLNSDSLLRAVSDNSSASRWYSIDPLADQFTSWSPYHFAYDNPISFNDPDGRSAEWVPSIQINKDKNGNETGGQVVVQMEKGDNAKTLASYLGVGGKKAEQLMSTMDKSGTIKLSDDVPGVSAINGAINDMITNSDNYSHNWLGATETFGDKNYNCWTCALAVTQGETPDFSKITSQSSFISDIKNNYTNVSSDPSKFQFGKTAISFGSRRDFGLGDVEVSHGAVYLGKSKDGTVYVFTKNGFYYPPQISTLKATVSEYNPVMGVNGEKGNGYYNPKR